MKSCIFGTGWVGINNNIAQENENEIPNSVLLICYESFTSPTIYDNLQPSKKTVKRMWDYSLKVKLGTIAKNVTSQKSTQFNMQLVTFGLKTIHQITFICVPKGSFQ